MKIVIDIQTFTDDPDDADAIIRRRLLSGPRTDLQIAGFQCTVVGEAHKVKDLPGPSELMVVEPMNDLNDLNDLEARVNDVEADRRHRDNARTAAVSEMRRLMQFREEYADLLSEADRDDIDWAASTLAGFASRRA